MDAKAGAVDRLGLAPSAYRLAQFRSWITCSHSGWSPIWRTGANEATLSCRGERCHPVLATRRRVIHREDRVGRTRTIDIECNCCGCRLSWDEPVPWEDRGPVECPSCGSHARHRLLAYFFDNDGRSLLDGRRSVLHFAPERWLESRLRSRIELDYITADLDPRRGMVQLDIEAIPFEQDRFDVILCFAVLDHVGDDRQAMWELHRVLKPGGKAILHVPGDWAAAETYEDPAIVEAEERRRAFGAPDHWRRYGLDFRDRLQEAGFTIDIDRYVRRLDDDIVRRHWMRSTGMFVCSKYRTPGHGTGSP
jgi:SAM-dependent methyltransferase